MVCMGADSSTSLREFLALCAESGTALPDELEFAVRDPFTVGETRFSSMETVDGRAPTETYGTVAGSALEAMLAAGAHACRMQIGAVAPEMDVPDTCFGHLALTDKHMTFEQASLLNPVGSIQRLHAAGPHVASCWIHSSHEQDLRGVARERCLGCYRPFGGEDGLQSTLRPRRDPFGGDFFDDVLQLTRMGRQDDVIGRFDAAAQAGAPLDTNHFSDHMQMVARQAILNNCETLLDYLLQDRWRQFSDVRGEDREMSLLRYVVEAGVSREMFTHVLGCGIPIELPDRNFFPALISNHYRSYENDSGALRCLLHKAQELLIAGHDPSIHTREYSHYSAFDACASWHGSYAEGSPEHKVECELLDMFFRHARGLAPADAEFDANSVYKPNSMITYMWRKKHPIALVRYMHERQGAPVDYTDAHGRNTLYEIMDEECVLYLLSKGVDPTQRIHDGRNIVTYILDSIIEDQTCYMDEDVLGHLTSLMELGVNKDNEAGTMQRVALLLNQGDDGSDPELRVRDAAICQWLLDFYKANAAAES